MVGWYEGTLGYHSDNGMLYGFTGIGIAYGEAFSVGDTVGCGIELVINGIYPSKTAIYFTKNGTRLGSVFASIGNLLVPAVSCCYSSARFSINFGDSPFVYEDSMVDGE